MPAPHQPDDQREDVDPTGIRDLLASLPDPDPMPDDLVRRIEARLEVEQTHRGTARASSAFASPVAEAGATVARADAVFDLAAERSHRRPVRTVAVLGAAAAGLMVTTVAVTQFMGLSGGGAADTAASYPSLARGDDGGAAGGAEAGDHQDDAAGADAGAEAGGHEGDGEELDEAADEQSGDALQDAAEGGDDAAGGADGERGVASLSETDPVLGGRLLVLPDLGSITADSLVPSLVSTLEHDDVRSAEQDGTPEQDLTTEQARSCWQVLAGEHAFEGHVAARAQFVPASGAGQPAVALLGLHDDGTGQAWVMPMDCTEDASAVPVSGPHPVVGHDS